MLTHCERSLPSKRTTASDGGLPAACCELGVAGVTTAGKGRVRSWSSQLGSSWAKHFVLSRARPANKAKAVLPKGDFLGFIKGLFGDRVACMTGAYRRLRADEKQKEQIGL